MTPSPEDKEGFFAPFELGARELASLVGGGGKTTLLRTLGRFLSRRGTVLLTTTTKMASDALPPLFLEDGTAPEDAAARIRAELSCLPHPLILAARRPMRDGDREKLEGFPPEAVDRLWEAGAADFVICEADGARQKPLKAWADWEPPVPSQTTLLCAVLGADRLDEPLTEEHVHRMALMTERFGLRPGDILTPERLAALLESPLGYLKNTPPTGRRLVLLNRSDRLAPARRDALTRGFLPRLARALRSWDLLILGSLRALRLDGVLPLERGR